MSKIFVASPGTHPSERRQAYVLLVLSVLFLLFAWILQLNPLAYPFGLLLFGLGMLFASFFNPYRLMIAGILITLIGLSIFFTYKNSFPGAGGSIVMAIGIGMLAIAFATRRGYVHAGALTPALFVMFVGLIEYSPTGHILAPRLAPFILSLWFPGLGLLLLGLIYFLLDYRQSKA